MLGDHTIRGRIETPVWPVPHSKLNGQIVRYIQVMELITLDVEVTDDHLFSHRNPSAGQQLKAEYWPDSTPDDRPPAVSNSLIIT